MRFVVAQIGARRRYAVPAILDRAGLLERFYTDLAGNIGAGKWLAQFGRLRGGDSLPARLAGRQVPAEIRTRTVTFPWRTVREVCRRNFRGSDAAAAFRGQLRWNAELGNAMARVGFGSATHLYSMLGECAPLLVEAKRRGITIVSEIYILLNTECVVAEERRAFPAWEASQPDHDTIRREFVDEGKLVCHTDFAVCPSEALRRDLEDNFGFPRGRSAVVPYGADARWLALPSQPQAGLVLFVGTADLRKGIHYLAMAAERLHGRGRDYEFRIAGNVKPQVAAQPICRHLNFLGRIPRDRIHEEYAKADLFVFPSLAEGSAEVTYEALAAGLPLITTAAAGSVMRDGIEGRIVPERNPIALALAIEEIVQNRQLRQTMAARARERARDYTLERYGERLLAAIRSFES